jgi:hypothetical protein
MHAEISSQTAVLDSTLQTADRQIGHLRQAQKRTDAMTR